MSAEDILLDMWVRCSLAQNRFKPKDTITLTRDAAEKLGIKCD